MKVFAILIKKLHFLQYCVENYMAHRLWWYLITRIRDIVSLKRTVFGTLGSKILSFIDILCIV